MFFEDYKQDHNLYDLYCERILREYQIGCDKENNCTLCKFYVGWKELCQNCKDFVLEWFYEDDFMIKIEYSVIIGYYDDRVERGQTILLNSELKTLSPSDLNELLYSKVDLQHNEVEDINYIDIIIYSYEDSEVICGYKSEHNLLDLLHQRMLDECIIACGANIYISDENQICQKCKNIIIEWLKENKFVAKHQDKYNVREIDGWNCGHPSYFDEYDHGYSIQWHEMCDDCKNILIAWFNQNNFNVKIKYHFNEERTEIELPSSLIKSSSISNESLYRKILFTKWPKEIKEIDIIITK